MTRLIDADKLKEKLQKHHDFFIEAWKENGVDKIEIPIPDKSRMDEITNCIAMVVNAPTAEPEKIYLAKINFDKEQLQEIVDKAKTEILASAERPQGKWIFDSEFTEFGNPYGTYKCDKCGGHSSGKYPFCFWCGADMRKEADNEQ